MEHQKKAEEEKQRRPEEELDHQKRIEEVESGEPNEEGGGLDENNDKIRTDTPLSAEPYAPFTCEMPGCNRGRCTLDDANDPKESQWCREHVCSVSGCSRVRVSSLDATGTVPFQYFETECDQHFVHPAAAKWERVSAMRDETSRASPSPNPGGDRKGKGKETGHPSSEGPGGMVQGRLSDQDSDLDFEAELQALLAQIKAALDEETAGRTRLGADGSPKNSERVEEQGAGLTTHSALWD
ncbi:hypothetical protein V8F33_003832 [Rhypophila sp. PSN 637]